jgi:CheY-like chemotaxis protein
MTLRRPLVLVVDDMTDNREMYIEYLATVGFRAVGAADGRSAIETARQLHPSVILMDMGLPGLDGWEATEILKADPRTRDILVIAVTGHAEPAFRARAEAVGCDVFLPKPVVPDELRSHIVALLDAGVRRAATSDE